MWLTSCRFSTPLGDWATNFLTVSRRLADSSPNTSRPLQSTTIAPSKVRVLILSCIASCSPCPQKSSQQKLDERNSTQEPTPERATAQAEAAAFDLGTGLARSSRLEARSCPSTSACIIRVSHE